MSNSYRGDDSTKQTRLFVWGNNDKQQLGLDNGQAQEEGSPSMPSEDHCKEISVPHQLEPENFS